MITDFLEGKETKVEVPVAQLSDIPAIIREVESADLVLLHAVDQSQAATVFQYLKERIPRNDVIDAGLLTQKAPERSKSEDIRFLWAARIAQNPMHVLALMQKEQLCDFDVTVMQDLYPELYQQVANELVAGVIAKYKPEEQIPRGIKKMLSIYLQVPVANAKTINAYKNAPKERNVQQVQITLSNTEQGQ